MLDSYVEATKHWKPGTDHGHRFVITVHGYASETNVLIIYSSQPVGVWLLRSFLRMESHLWEMFVLSQVASCLLIYMFWIFFCYSFLFDFQAALFRTNNHWHFHFSKPILKAWLGLPHLRIRRMVCFYQRITALKLETRQRFPNHGQETTEAKRCNAGDYS